MRIGVLILICAAVLVVFGTLNDFTKKFHYKRVSLVMFCGSVIILNIFRLNVIPELSINPACIFIVFVTLFTCLERSCSDFYRAFICVIVLTLLQIDFGQYFNGELLGLFGLLIAPLFNYDKLPITVVCVCTAPTLAYMLPIMLDMSGMVQIHTQLDASGVLDAQIVGMVTAWVCAYVGSLSKIRKPQPAK